MNIEYRKPDAARITGAAGIISDDGMTGADWWDLANLLEPLNTPGNQGTPIRRLTDMCWALCNDTSAIIAFNSEDGIPR